MADSKSSSAVAGSIDSANAALNVPTEESKDFVSCSGVVLELTKVPRYMIYEAGKRFDQSMPRPPVVRDTEKQRDFENPDDPEYIRLITAHEDTKNDMTNNLYFALGTKVKFKPDDVPDVDDDWDSAFDDLLPADARFDVPAKGTRLRYLAWLKSVVLLEDDYRALTARIFKIVGVPTQEADVADAAADFRSGSERAADTGSADAAEVRLGDTNPE